MAEGEARGLGWLSSPVQLRIRAEAITWTLLALGVLLRVLDYIGNRGLYMDERRC